MFESKWARALFMAREDTELLLHSGASSCIEMQTMMVVAERECRIRWPGGEYRITYRHGDGGGMADCNVTKKKRKRKEETCTVQGKS